MGTKLRSLFDYVVTADDVKHGKPAPDVYLEAARRMQVDPASCVVFEDSDEGLEAAHRAGMRAIGVLGGSPVPERLRGASPDAMIKTIRELPALLRNF